MADSVALTLDVPHQGFEHALRRLIDDGVASGLAGHDATLWGRDAEHEASIRLSWTDAATKSRGLVAEIESLRSDLNDRGLDHVVLCGMGGSSLAPEVICRAAEVELTVLDSSQPDMVRRALADRLERSIVVVSSKSGSTVETDSQRRAYEQAFADAGLTPSDHIVVVTDPDSPLDGEATEAGYRVFHADPEVGGRYSALTAFGLVPSGLAGADIGALLDDAEHLAPSLTLDDADNPALRLGAVLGVANRHHVDKLVLADQTRAGLGDWIEQLVAESTGKIGRGILPVVVPFENAVNFYPSTADSVLVAIGGRAAPEAQSGYGAAVGGPLGAQMLLWETAVAIAGRLIGINPFDQPDVESAKQAARDRLGQSSSEDPTAQGDGITAYGIEADSVQAAVTALLDQLDLSHGYVAIQAYLDRIGHPAYAGLREVLAQRTGRPVTFGWGPRFLHSTGQYHKGGPPNGVFLQLTSDPVDDLPVPGRDFTFGQFIASQAEGDAQVLRDHGRPVLRLHLADVEAALPTLRELLT
ncbi:glucose-6-phosphate isomerase [Aeromicrobium terrae]|uniref:Glucose-6-phosphate isomerase n=1 Tax=Aeromicrobium terrae TaxID=2498846 RepID=A0A5C8NN37_9ACTN|nr:glucose-6-phosphate isomerase [Aeromicrobium terrae]TXL63159.1 glucose-6-phosphate isomerase [Aeromicrobium terrae]